VQSGRVLRRQQQPIDNILIWTSPSPSAYQVSWRGVALGGGVNGSPDETYPQSISRFCRDPQAAVKYLRLVARNDRGPMQSPPRVTMRKCSRWVATERRKSCPSILNSLLTNSPEQPPQNR
jgi:hypothetical protein